MGYFDKLKNIINPTNPTKKATTDVVISEKGAVAHFLDNYWQNSRSNIGTDGSVGRANCFQIVTISDQEASDLYVGDKLVTRIIDLPVDEAFAKKWKLTFSKEDLGSGITSSEMNEIVQSQIEEMYNLREVVKKACKWARIYGNSYLVPMLHDNADTEDPLDLNDISKIESFQVFSPTEILPLIPDLRPDSPNYLRPDYYQFATYGFGKLAAGRIHHSRIIRFDGSKIPRDNFIKNAYKNQSVIAPIREVVASYGVAVEAVSSMVHQYSFGVYKSKLAGTNISSDSISGQALMKRVSLMERGKAIAKTIILTEGEDYLRQSGQFSGIGELLDKLKQDISVRVDIPQNILFNQGTSGVGNSGSLGSGGKGESERSDWEAFIANYQKENIKSPLSDIYKLIFSSHAFKIELQEKTGSPMKLDGKKPYPCFDIIFESTRDPNPNEEAELQVNLLTADGMALELGLISADEARNSRYGKNGTFAEFNTSISIDEKLTAEDIQKQKVENAQAMMPPEADPEDPENEEEEGEEGEKAEKGEESEKKEKPDLKKKEKPNGK